jgi:hypothetical protein
MFRPEFSGRYSPEKLRPDFIAALSERVRKGLFPLASERRNRYAVVSESDRELRFRSEGLLTSVNIGWNDVHVQIDLAPASPGSPPQIHYNATYWGWAKYGYGLCAILGIALIACWLVFGTKFAPYGKAAKWVFWPSVIFWGFVWPWILVAVHRRPAARALERLFAEVNESQA